MLHRKAYFNAKYRQNMKYKLPVFTYVNKVKKLQRAFRAAKARGAWKRIWLPNPRVTTIGTRKTAPWHRR